MKPTSILRIDKLKFTIKFYHFLICISIKKLHLKKYIEMDIFKKCSYNCEHNVIKDIKITD